MHHWVQLRHYCQRLTYQVEGGIEMPTYAVINSETRVILRMTTDDPPPLGVGEEAVVVKEGLDLAGGPWKLDIDGTTLVIPTAGDLAATFPPDPRIKAIQDACDALQADLVTSPKMKDLAAALKQYAIR